MSATGTYYDFGEKQPSPSTVMSQSADTVGVSKYSRAHFFLPSLVCLNLDTNQMIFRTTLGRICLPSDGGNPSRTTAWSPNNYLSKNSSSVSCHFNHFTTTDRVGASLISYYKYHTSDISDPASVSDTSPATASEEKKQTGKMLCAFTAIIFPISLFSVQNTT